MSKKFGKYLTWEEEEGRPLLALKQTNDLRGVDANLVQEYQSLYDKTHPVKLNADHVNDILVLNNGMWVRLTLRRQPNLVEGAAYVVNVLLPLLEANEVPSEETLSNLERMRKKILLQAENPDGIKEIPVSEETKKIFNDKLSECEAGIQGAFEKLLFDFESIEAPDEESQKKLDALREKVLTNFPITKKGECQ